MDISKEYIEMCSKAQEIQANRKPLWGFCCLELGDYFVNKDQNYIYSGEDQPKVTDTIWLPRQDQLQVLLHDKLLYPTTWFNRMAFVFLREKKANFIYKTAEQLWLGMVMFENYNKQWCKKTSEWVQWNDIIIEI